MTFEEIRTIMQRKTVGIAGAGGLGSNCAMALVRIGLGKLIIADFDVVSESNLNRQFYFRDQIGEKKIPALKTNLLRINPCLDFVGHDCCLVPDNIEEVFKGCDIIVEAFDRADQKAMLIETILTEFPDTPLVIGLGMAGVGLNDTIHCRQIDNMYICGDEVSEIGPDCPPIAPRVGIVSNMQANVVTEILLSCKL